MNPETLSIELATSEILLQTIVVAVDFSPQSTQALKEVISIARCFGSEILLVHGATPTVFDAGAATILIECYELELDAAKAKMAELVAGEPDLQDVSHREFVAYARAVDLVLFAQPLGTQNSSKCLRMHHCGLESNQQSRQTK